jgi:hypothetical protein
MATITTRSGKGSPLTNTEVDNNFTNLNSAKYESGNNVTLGTISSDTVTITHDTFGEGLILKRNHASNAASIVFKNNAGKQGTLYGTLGEEQLFWMSGTDVVGSVLWNAGNDGSGSGLDADKLDGVEGSGYVIKSGDSTITGTLTVKNDIVTHVISPITCPHTPANGPQSLILNAGESKDKIATSAQASEYVYINAEEGLVVTTPDAEHLNWQAGYTTNLSVLTGRHMTINGNKVWHSGNDGSGSGLDADRLGGMSEIQFRKEQYVTNCTTDAVGWHRVAESTASAGRGSFEVVVYTSGGSHGPGQLIIRGMKGYSTGAPVFHSVEHLGPNYYSKVRGVHGTDGYGYVEVYFSSVMNGVHIRSKHLGMGNFGIPVSTLIDKELDPAAATNTTVGAEVAVHANRVNIVNQLYNDGNVVWQAGNDGSGSGLDADTVDGIEASSFLRSDADGTTTGHLAFSDTGYSIGNEYSTWKRKYSISTSAPGELRYRDGNALPNGGAYRFHAHISDTGTDQSATAVFWNQNGTWKLNVTYQSGGSSNHPEFYINDAGLPGIYIDHAQTYVVHVLGERMELSETSTDNKSGFGTDAYFSVEDNILRYNPHGDGPIGSGDLVWHAGNQGTGSGLDADKVDGLEASAFAAASINSFVCDGITDLNSISGTGSTRFRPFISNYHASNRAGSNYTSGFHIGTLNKYASQLGFVASAHSSPPKFRNMVNDEWGSWYSLWHNGNDGSGSGLDADTVDGYHHGSFVRTSGGIAANLNTSYTAGMHSWNTTTVGKPTDNYGQTLNIVSHGLEHNDTSNWITQLGFGTGKNSAYFRSKTNDGAWGDWKTFWHTGNDGSGSGLDADTLDGVQASSFVQPDADGRVVLTGSSDFTANIRQCLLVLKAPSSNRPYIQFSESSSNTISSGMSLEYNGYPAGDLNYMAFNSVAGASVHKFYSGGNYVASGNVTAYSDERLKENVETLDGSKVYEMRGVSFTKDGAASSGVIAQELQKVAPELVHDDGEYLSVAYGNTIGYLIEAIKDLKAEIDELKGDQNDAP